MVGNPFGMDSYTGHHWPPNRTLADARQSPITPMRINTPIVANCRLSFDVFLLSLLSFRSPAEVTHPPTPGLATTLCLRGSMPSSLLVQCQVLRCRRLRWGEVCQTWEACKIWEQWRPWVEWVECLRRCLGRCPCSSRWLPLPGAGSASPPLNSKLLPSLLRAALILSAAYSENLSRATGSA